MKLINIFVVAVFLIPTMGISQITGTNNLINKWEKEGNVIDSTDFIGTINAMPLIFRSNNNERMRITSKGNVGIGVENPTKRLEVNGPTLLNGDLFLPKLDTGVLSKDINEILFIDESGKVFKGGVTDLKRLVYSNPYSENSSAICEAGIVQQSPSWISAPYKLYTLCPDTKIGIGTESPTATLDVNGSAKMISATLTNRLNVGKSTSLTGMIVGNYLGLPADPYGIFDLKFTNQQTNVTTSVFKLMPDGQLFLNGQFIVKNDGTEDYISLLNTTTGTTIFAVDKNGNLKLKNSNRTVFYVDVNQETVHARKIVVDEQNWPDYVFKKDYSLPTLEEVDVFIKTNGHLPNLPTAEEVKENGVDLGEMVKKLTQKVEELTLYTIQQQKEIEKLKESLKEK